MAATCVIGLQWGDEAKGKLVDLLAPHNDFVVRYQGGANAGHTVVDGKNVYKLHHIPSGILHSHVQNVIAPGVVVEPNMLIREIDGLEARGFKTSQNLKISERVHLVMPWHLVEDQIIDGQKVSGENIGTTLRGIGPCYRDKVGRTMAFRLADLLSPNRADRIEQILEAKHRLLSHAASDSQLEMLEASSIIESANAWANRLEIYAANTTDDVLDALDANQSVLLEGAQGSLLDIDHGTFPFVTSSNASGAGISAGSGVPAKWIKRVIGVAKAYSTRVGGGPFPTELHCDTGQKIRDLGNEYGTTTGRPRRCGWFDAVAVQYTVRLGGITELALMMMDVLGHFEEINVCTAYELHGKKLHRMPSRAEDIRECKPIYETLPGWNCDLTSIRTFDDIPHHAKQYAEFIGSLVGVPVSILSVGPDRAQTISVGDDAFATT